MLVSCVGVLAASCGEAPSRSLDAPAVGAPATGGDTGGGDVDGTMPGVGSAVPAPDAPRSGEVGPDSTLPLAGSEPAPGAGAASAQFLSDLCASGGETNGWGPIERDLSNGEQAASDGGPISIGDVVYTKGLGMHAPADVRYDLRGRCTRLSTWVGVDDEMKSAGSVRFEVWGDGALLGSSEVLTGADPAALLEVDVSGVSELRLVADAADGNGSDHADWADARVECFDALEACAAQPPAAPEYPGYELIWADEFDREGAPDAEHWSFENGFVRNEEAQWYQPGNASVRAGFLIIEGRRERVANPNYRAGSGDWKTNREFAEYTSSSLHTRGKQSFRFGRLEMRGRFPAHDGLWPAWWTLGNDGEWPSNGEVDILEFYGGGLHANFVVGTNTRWQGNWDAVTTPLSTLGDADWDARFHVYRMDWNEESIALEVDGYRLNDMNVDELLNPDGQSPFLAPHYMLLNLAIGGQAAGNPSAVPFPVRYEIDYVRVYQ